MITNRCPSKPINLPIVVAMLCSVSLCFGLKSSIAQEPTITPTATIVPTESMGMDVNSIMGGNTDGTLQPTAENAVGAGAVYFADAVEKVPEKEKNALFGADEAY